MIQKNSHPDGELLVHPLVAHLKAVATKDIVLLRDAFTLDALFIGTDDLEVWPIENLAQILSNTDSGWSMESRNLIISGIKGGSDSVATFYEVVVHEKYGTMRGSGTLAKEADGKWRIALYVLSFSVPNDIAENVDFLNLLAV